MSTNHKMPIKLRFGGDILMMYYPITRHRAELTQDYIQNEVDNGAVGYNSFAEADAALDFMDTDDSDYEVCAFIDGRWVAVRDGVICHRNLM